MMILPVIMGDSVIGTIGLDSAQPRVFSEQEIVRLKVRHPEAAVLAHPE